VQLNLTVPKYVQTLGLLLDTRALDLRKRSLHFHARMDVCKFRPSAAALPESESPVLQVQGKLMERPKDGLESQRR